MLNLSSSLVPVYVYICWLYLRVVKENFSMDSFAVRLILLLLPEMTANELLIFITGVVKSNRSIWRLRTITDFFWAIVNFIGVFFVTMFSMEKSDAYRKSSGSGKKWDGGGPGGPGRGPYGGGPRGPPRGLDNVRGIDHSALPACGSCCGG